MYKAVSYLCFFVCVASMGVMLGSNITYAAPLQTLNTKDTNSSLTQSVDKVIDTSSIQGNPITNGSDSIVGKNPGIKGKIEGITTISNQKYTGVLSATTQKITSFVDWSLSILALLCLLYLIYQGVLMLVKIDDEKAQGEALGSIKTVAWVLGGIGLSWTIVRFAFYLVTKFTS